MIRCIRITDPREKELPKVGIITMEDGETGEIVTINTNKKRFGNCLLNKVTIVKSASKKTQKKQVQAF